MAPRTVVLLLLAGALAADASGVTQGTAADSQAAANPIRKVVGLLQRMQHKVEQEAEHATELHDRFMCYCKSSGGNLGRSIEEAKTRIPELDSSIETASSRKAQLEKDIKSHQADRDAAKTAMAEATALREKDKTSFDKESTEDKVNLEALKKATAAVEQGVGGSFLQTQAASRLRAIVGANKDLLDADRQAVLAFLAGGGAGRQGYAPQSGEIVGILKQISDEMFGELKEVIAAEEAAVQAFEELMTAKKKEVAALSEMLEVKFKRVGELGVEVATMKNDFEDTQETLAEDQQFAADLEKNCAEKTKVFEQDKQMRAMEVTALADTIKVLNDDDALDLFKATLPSASASFLQVQVSASSLRAQARAMVTELRRRFPLGRHQLDFISLALQGKQIGFDKVLALIDELVATLKADQQDDDSKKEYCAKQFDESDDQKKSQKRAIADLSTVIEEATEGLATLAEEIAALKEGIVALDKAVAEATEQRREEHSAYKELMQSNSAAKELILFAKNRLNQFYNPKLYKPPPKRELSEEDRINVNMGGTAPPTPPPGGIAGTGISAASLLQLAARDDAGRVAPPPPPETAAAYTKKAKESGGVMAMMDLLVKDLDKEMTVAKTEEENAQEGYEQTMADSAEKRAQDSKALTDKEAAKAELQSSLEESQSEKAANTKELVGTMQYIQSLHSSCDFLVKYYDVRREARSDEIDSLGQAKAVLSGADYALLQTGRSASSRPTKFLRRH